MSATVYSPVYTLKNECQDCYRCVRECHVKAIKIQNNSASVISEKCVACGHCVKVCPAGAKKVRNDIEEVKALIRSGKKVFVSLAPSWSGLYELKPERMIALLKMLGFYAVSETALGAQEVSIQTAAMLKEANSGLYISSACPVAVDYIRQYKTNFAKNIVALASPALTHAKLLKKHYGSDIAIVFIGPCIGKKQEAASHTDFMQAALTFEELRLWINEEDIMPEDILVSGENKFLPWPAHEGALYPMEGGMNETLRLGGIGKDIEMLNVSGFRSIDLALDGLNEKKLNKKIFLEVLSCEGGCLNGPCAGIKKSGIEAASSLIESVNYRENIPEKADIIFAEDYKMCSAPQAEPALGQITEALAKIGKHSAEDELNCGGCGYSTCRDMAKALVRGTAEPSMCVAYLRKTAMRKAAAMLRSMSSAVVMVDKSLKIIEANDAFMKAFCADIYDVVSSRKEVLSELDLDRTVPFGDVFRQLLTTGGDIHKPHYMAGNKVYDLNAFTIERGEIVGAVITDVTKAEFDREKIAAKAKEVIQKNISKVQEIACLLGEHMVETEVLLNSIAEDYSSVSEETKKEK